MNTDINVKVLLKEVKRKIILILIVSLTISGFFVYRYFAGIKTQASSTSYSSTCVIRINDVINEAYKTPVDTTDYNRFVIKSDNTIAELKSMLGQNKKYTDEYLRDSIFAQGNQQGRIIDINIVTDSQESSNEICNALLALVEQEKIDFGATVDIIQHCVERGPVTVKFEKTSYNPNKKQFVITDGNEVVTPSKLGIAKSFVFGGGFGLLIAVFIVLLLYLVRNTIKYEDELTDTGFNVISIKKEDNNYGIKVLACELLSQNIDKEIYYFISLGCHNRLIGFASMLEEYTNKKIKVIEMEPKDAFDNTFINEVREGNESIKTIIVGHDGINNPEAIAFASNANKIMIVIEKDNVSLKDVTKYTNMFGDKMAGFVFFA